MEFQWRSCLALYICLAVPGNKVFNFTIPRITYYSSPIVNFQQEISCTQWRSQPDNLVMLCKFFCVYRPYKESISKEMNNDNDLNLHSMTK